jgi:hypothetical protein
MGMILQLGKAERYGVGGGLVDMVRLLLWNGEMAS